MKLSQELEHSLSARDLNGIRAALIGYLDIGGDSNAVLIADEIDNRLKLSGMELFDKDDGCDIMNSASPREALLEIKAALRLNFSQEKIRKGAELRQQVEFAGKSAGSGISIPAAQAGNASVSPIGFIPSNSGKHSAPVAQSDSTNERARGNLSSPEDRASDNTEVVIPPELRRAVSNGETSSVKALLIGYLDVFDKTEPLPVIQFAAYCKDNMGKKGIQLFAEDDKSIDFSVTPLTAETLLTLKAELRLNFSLEKMIFAEKIFQQELARKLQQKPVSSQPGQTVSTPRPAPVQPGRPVSTPRPAPAQPGQTVSTPRPAPVQPGQTVSTPRPAPSQPGRPVSTPRPAPAQPGQTVSTPKPVPAQPGHERPQGHVDVPDGKIIKIEVVYNPGPLEHLFGQIGKFFDTLFNKEGKRVERPYHDRK